MVLLLYRVSKQKKVNDDRDPPRALHHTASRCQPAGFRPGPSGRCKSGEKRFSSLPGKSSKQHQPSPHLLSSASRTPQTKDSSRL